MFRYLVAVLAFAAFALTEGHKVDYTGHKVFSVTPKSEKEIEFLLKLRHDYNVDLWNEPRMKDVPVLMHLAPNLAGPVEEALKKYKIKCDVVFNDLQRTIEAERVQCAPSNVSQAVSFDFGRYHPYQDIVNLLNSLATNYPNIAKLETVGTTSENRPIYSLKISAGNTPNKPAVMMECGIHAREWSSVAVGAYLVNRLVTTYGKDPVVTGLVDKYEFNIVVEANPDGYVYTWTNDRMWRKTRSKSSADWLGVCRGADANRNFDIEHCGVGTSRQPCNDIYCGDKPFSEGESRALRDLMIKLKDRMKVYFSIHAYSQLWMTPYGTTKKLPPNYFQLEKIGNIGVTALAKRYGTRYRLGSIANIIYEAAGSSLDYAYIVQGVKIGYALELRDQGQFGFFLRQQDILPTCEETFDGIQAVLQAL